MLLQIINIGSGLVASSTLVKDTLKNDEVSKALDSTHSYEKWIGVAVLAFGILGLIERLGIMYFGIQLGSSFPQALPAIATGLVLGAPYLERFAFLHSTIKALTPYRSWLGLLAIACGLGSLLVGCVLPLVCTAPFGI